MKDEQERYDDPRHTPAPRLPVMTAKYHSSFADISNSRSSLSLIDDIDFSQSAYISECPGECLELKM